MHACGHDGHTAIGLGVASLVPTLAQNWRGKLKLIFQPAEEGCRGAKSMVAAGVLNDVDHYFATHLGISLTETGAVACGTDHILATTKLDATFRGIAAHAGVDPHIGRNALLAAATATVQLHAIARHGAGASRINVGLLEGGSGRNVIADRAVLKLEVRGETTPICAWMAVEAERVLRAAAVMHGVEITIENMGEAGSAPCDESARAIVRRAAEKSGATRIVDSYDGPEIEDCRIWIGAEIDTDRTNIVRKLSSNISKVQQAPGGLERARRHRNVFDLGRANIRKETDRDRSRCRHRKQARDLNRRPSGQIGG
jgi:aminobenzoyl-glutamate utilization protein A